MVPILFLTLGIATTLFQIYKHLFNKPLANFFYKSADLQSKKPEYCVGYILGYNATLIFGLILLLVGYLLYIKKSSNKI